MVHAKDGANYGVGVKNTFNRIMLGPYPEKQHRQTRPHDPDANDHFHWIPTQAGVFVQNYFYLIFCSPLAQFK